MPYVHIMRHGEAEPHMGTSDADRALTPVGRQKIEKAAHGFKHTIAPPDHIFCSPYRRTRQTAAIVADVLGITGVEIIEALEPGATPNRVTDALEGCWKPSNLIVGHMPDVSYLTGHFISRASAAPVSFAPGTVACLVFAHGVGEAAGRLAWLMPQEMLGGLP